MVGGYRPGGGRPKSSPHVKNDSMAVAAAKAGKRPRALGKTPLEYMLEVMNDEAADETRRDRMAQAAAPYVHAKAEAAAPGKKEEADASAKSAHVGTEWGGLVN